jgi:dihydroflavonol-4-reductase
MSAREAFVTGGTGFVGINVVQELLAQGWAVTCLHRPTSDLTYLKRFQVRLAEGTILDPVDRLAALIPEGTNTVFHVAGDTNQWKRRNAEQTRNNVEGTRHMVEAALKRGVRRVVVTSSIAAYGTQEGEIDETTPTRAPTSWVNYQKTKWQAEKVTRELMPRGIEAAFMNPGVVMGPYDFGTWSRSFLLLRDDRLPGVPPGASTFCHVREVARAHVAAADRGENGGNYILGGTNATYREMMEIMAELLGKTLPKGDIPGPALRLAAWINDIAGAVTGKEPSVTPEIADMLCKRVSTKSEKAQAHLDYRLAPLREMVVDTYEWMKAEGRL